MWDGRTWRDEVAAPNPTAPRSALTSVSCTAPDECLAYAVACGAESTQRLGAGLVDARQVDRLVADVEVEVVPATADVG